MSQVILPSGTEAELQALVAAGDAAWDVTNRVVRVGDGVTQGGVVLGTAEQVARAGTAAVTALVTQATAGAAQATASAQALATSLQLIANTLAAQADASGRWAMRILPDGSCRVAKLQDGRGRRLDQLIDANTDAIAALGLRATDLQLRADKAVGTAIEPTANAVEGKADASGRWVWTETADGGFRIAKPQDARGRRLDLAIDANVAAIAALAGQLALLPPVPILRLKRALFNGQARPIAAADPLVVAAPATASTIAGGTTYPLDSPRVRLLGGRWAPGTTFPGTLFMFQNSVTYNASAGGVPAGNTVFEFLLLGDQFEWLTLGTGAPGAWSLEVDGVATNDVGYASAPNDTGSGYFHRVTLSAGGGVPRRIRVTTPGRSFGGVNVPAGAALLDPAPAVASSMVVVGDSITEGSVATASWRRWAAQLGYRLGIDNVDVSGVGGSGYLQALGYNGAKLRNGSTTPDYRFRERISDVLTAINGGPPDLCVVAGGINDSALDPAAVGAEALLYFRALRAAAPNMSIIVLGPFWNDSAYPPNLVTIRDAIFAAAGQVQRIATVDVSSWYARPERSTWFNGAVNGPHPIDAGHFAYGQLAAAAIAPIIAGL